MTVIAAEIYPLLRKLAWVRGAMRGIMAAFVGLLASVVLTLGDQIQVSQPPEPGCRGTICRRGVQVVRAAGLRVGIAAWGIYLAFGGAVRT